MDAVVDADMSGRWYQVSRFFWMVIKVFGYIFSKSRGLCGVVMCVMFIWLVGVCLLGVCYGVGVVCLRTWRLLEGRVKWGMHVICVMFVFICVCCYVDCPYSMFWAVCGEIVVVCVCVYGIVVCEVGLCSMCCNAVTSGGVFVRRAACCG